MENKNILLISLGIIIVGIIIFFLFGRGGLVGYAAGVGQVGAWLFIFYLFKKYSK